jgi:hypothetical protein
MQRGMQLLYFITGCPLAAFYCRRNSMVKALKEINEMVYELNAISSDCNTLADEIDWSEVSDKASVWANKCRELFIKKNELSKENTKRIDLIIDTFKDCFDQLPEPCKQVLIVYSNYDKGGD